MPRRPAFPLSLPLVLLAAAAPLAAQAPTALAAERAVAQSPDATPRWSYGIFVHHLGAAKRWVVGGQPLVEDGNIGRFIAKIGGDSTDVPDRRAPEEAWNAAILGVLGRQGWELVGCETFGDDMPESYRCYLKRRVADENPGAGR